MDMVGKSKLFIQSVQRKSNGRPRSEAGCSGVPVERQVGRDRKVDIQLPIK
jgi:hypothetical protein